MSTRTTRLNDVDIASVGGLIEKVREEPEVASTTWSAEVRWTGGFRSESAVRDFAPVPSDEPAALGGTDTAANPVEQLLGALGNCLAVGYAANATAAGIELTDLRIELEGDLNLHTFLGLGDDGHAGYEHVRVRVHIDADADEEALSELHARVVGTSPVGHTFVRPIPVDVELA